MTNKPKFLMGPTSPSPQTSSSSIFTAKLDAYDISPYVTAPEIFNHNIQLLKLKIQSILDPSESMDPFSIKQKKEEELSALLGYSIAEILPVITKKSTAIPNELTASQSQSTDSKHLQLPELAKEDKIKTQNLLNKLEPLSHVNKAIVLTQKDSPIQKQSLANTQEITKTPTLPGKVEPLFHTEFPTSSAYQPNATPQSSQTSEPQLASTTTSEVSPSKPKKIPLSATTNILSDTTPKSPKTKKTTKPISSNSTS
jgi:hypothetical protein